MGFLLYSLLFIFIACSDQQKVNDQNVQQDTIVKKEIVSEVTSEEDKMVNAVLALPEVEQVNQYIDSISDHKKGVAAICDGKEEGSNDVCVRVGYNGDERFEVYYFFYVDPVNMRIKIQDIVNDTILPIEEWRKRKALIE